MTGMLEELKDLVTNGFIGEEFGGTVPEVKEEVTEPDVEKSVDDTVPPMKSDEVLAPAQLPRDFNVIPEYLQFQPEIARINTHAQKKHTELARINAKV